MVTSGYLDNQEKVEEDNEVEKELECNKRYYIPCESIGIKIIDLGCGTGRHSFHAKQIAQFAPELGVLFAWNNQKKNTLKKLYICSCKKNVFY